MTTRTPPGEPQATPAAAAAADGGSVVRLDAVAFAHRPRKGAPVPAVEGLSLVVRRGLPSGPTPSSKSSTRCPFTVP